MPDWTDHVIWWHVYPLGFTGADTTGADRTPVHRLAHIESWLDYLLELGANGLALGPVFASGTHGYDTIDYFEIDPRLGDAADLDHLVAEAHARGIRVMLDGVFNHVGRDFVRPELVRRSESGEAATFEGHDLLQALDHDDPEVADFVVSVMDHWLERGIDAWRLDAAYSVPTAFWAAVLPRVRSVHPEVYVVGEVLHGDLAEFVAEGTLDSVTQYELWQAVWHSLAEANFFELDWALKRHAGFLARFVPYTFVGNHDVTRLASLVADDRHLAHALVLLFTLGGTPSVYYGDERGMKAVKEQRVGGDDAVRPAYPATPAELPADGAGVFALHRELVSLRRRHAWLHTATSRTLELTNTEYVIELVAGDERLIVALNIGDAELEVRDATVSLAGDARDADTGFVVPAHGWAVLA
jgi:cyclomaltodextrinase